MDKYSGHQLLKEKIVILWVKLGYINLQKAYMSKIKQKLEFIRGTLTIEIRQMISMILIFQLGLNQ